MTPAPAYRLPFGEGPARGTEARDTRPYAVEREIEDLAALIEEAGGEASVYGISSGAALVLEAADRLPGITRLAVDEAPFVVDGSGKPLDADFLSRVRTAVDTGRRGDAVRLFLRRVGMPAPAVAVMRLLPVWRKLTAAAPTLPYDLGIVAPHSTGRPLGEAPWPGIRIPVLVMDGGKSPQWMRSAMAAVAAAIPTARHRTLPGQTHLLKPDAVAPVLTPFYADAGADSAAEAAPGTDSGADEAAG